MNNINTCIHKYFFKIWSIYKLKILSFPDNLESLLSLLAAEITTWIFPLEFLTTTALWPNLDWFSLFCNTKVAFWAKQGVISLNEQSSVKFPVGKLFPPLNT